MAFTQHFIGIFLFLIIFLLNPPVIAKQTNYVPPSSDRYTQQTRSQTSRNPTQKLIDFEILAPSQYIAATFLEKPVFYLYFHKILGNISFDITIETPNGKIIHSQQLPVNRTGILPLSIDGSLPEGRYILSVAYNCPKDCQGIRIAFNRKGLTDEQGKTLSKLADIKDKANYLAEIGYYYDSIHYELENRVFSGTDSHNNLD
jgi:hypothetical protein